MWVAYFVITTQQIGSEFASLFFLTSAANLAKTPLASGSRIGSEKNAAKAGTLKRSAALRRLRHWGTNRRADPVRRNLSLPRENQSPQRQSAAGLFTVTDFGAHPALLLAEFAAPLARFLRSHYRLLWLSWISVDDPQSGPLGCDERAAACCDRPTL